MAARKGAGFVRAATYQKKEFGPGGTADVSISESPITEQEYFEARQEGPLLDSASVRDDFAVRQQLSEQAKSVKESIEAQAPSCPVHGKRMKLVRGPKAFFFGCVKGVKCSEKAWLTAAQKDAARILDKVPPIH